MLLRLSSLERSSPIKDCPLSPHLFIICIELLAFAMRNDHSLNGISCRNKSLDFTSKIRLYADDTILTLPGDEKSLKRALEIFNLRLD